MFSVCSLADTIQRDVGEHCGRRREEHQRPGRRGYDRPQVISQVHSGALCPLIAALPAQRQTRAQSAIV